jgi:hypothetical protein
MERSPHKWKTMYRDHYRKFRQSPGKDPLDEEIQEGMEVQDPMIITQVNTEGDVL